ncbi:hypothetical protein [Yinghuangia sp. YIM S10712]|uniref:hypothetical protein n=1 Tax=Yinghuangia sp. YIM S10712 TaxID=3436930 RepID=UPI003F534E64
MALAIRPAWWRTQEVTRQQPAEVQELAQRIHDGTFAYEPPGPFGEVVDRARKLARWGDCDGAWRVLRAGLPLWRPPAHDVLAPVGLLADPLLAPVITLERGKELLGTPRAGRTEPAPDPTEDLDPTGLAWLASEASMKLG